MVIDAEKALYIPEQGFSNQVAEILGGDVTPEQIEALIEASNRNGIIFHGIHDSAKIPNIERQGILPLTPEGGFVSYWSLGKPLFATNTSRGLTTYDSTFFHYAPNGRTNGEKKPSMNIAATQLKLVKPGVQVPPNQQVTIDRAVPRSDLALLKVSGHVNGRSAQVRMFELLEEVVTNFTPGITMQSLR